MKSYLIFLLIFWPSWIIFNFWYWGYCKKFAKPLGILLGWRKFYKIRIIMWQVPDEDVWLRSLDLVPAVKYPLVFRLNYEFLVEEIPCEEEDNKYYPTSLFVTVKKNGRYDDDQRISRYTGVRILHENIIKKEKIKVGFIDYLFNI